jgi:predicted dinucleotide-binding enzyme
MDIGIIGSGNMGRSLGVLWAEQGHRVFFGSRDANRGQAMAATVGRGTQGGSNDEAAAFGEVLLWTVRGVAPADLLADPAGLAGKTIIDCNNSKSPPNFEYPAIAESLAEQFAQTVPAAHVVKAFNTMAQEVFELAPEPLRQYQVSAFVAGDDALAKQRVMQLAADIGFVPLDCGGLRQARLLEGLGDFIRLIIMGQGQGPYATLSVQVLPPAAGQRLGGRQASTLP